MNGSTELKLPQSGRHVYMKQSFFLAVFFTRAEESASAFLRARK